MHIKILAIADRKPERSLREWVLETRPDLIVTLGDLDYFDLQELESISDILKIGVYGNHCSGRYFESLGIENMHLKTINFNGVVIGGFEGSVRYKMSQTAKMYDQEEVYELLKDFPYVDVMLCHAPPFGVNDEPEELTHQGFKALREYVEEKKPKHLFHGHTYPKPGEEVDRLGETIIHYVFGVEFIEIDV